MKKRNKKYNPNKLVQLYQNELSKSYELWSSFDDVELTEAADKLKALDATQRQAIEGMYAYFDGDLIVPILWDLMVDDMAFFVGMDSYYYHENDPSDIKSSAVQFNVPSMTYDQFKLGGSEAKLVDEHGFKRRWKGLEEETDDVHKPFLDKGYKLFKCMCYMKADVKFKSFEAYQKFKAERVVRGMHRKYHLQEQAA